MRIAFPMFSYGGMGGEKVVARLAGASRRHGHDASVFLPAGSRTRMADSFSNVVEYPVLPILSSFPPTMVLANTFQLARCLRDYDVVVPNYAPTVLPVKLGSGPRVEVYYIVQHDEMTFFTPSSFEYWITRLSFRAFDHCHFFVVSRWLHQMIEDRYGFDSVLLPPGINHETFYPRERRRHKGKQVLFLARKRNWRGIGVLLDAMEIVRKTVTDVRLVAASRTPTALKSSCPIEYVAPSDEELADLYSSCDVFVLPSFLEGMPVPPLEAMACAGVVVLTDCKGTRDYAVHESNCIVVPAGEPARLAEAIVRVLTDEDLSIRLRTNGPLSAAPWTYERMERIFLKELEIR